MNLNRAVERANTIRGDRAAAGLYNDIEYELALGDPAGDLETEGERALGILERRFPGVKDTARDVETPPSTSRRARATETERGHSGRSRTAARSGGPPARHGRGQTTRRPASTPPRRSARVRQAAGVVTARAGSAVAGAYDTADDSTGGLISQLILGGVALSIFYLFLTRAAAAGKLFEGATNVVRGVVSPTVDPLNPKGALR